jgi:hypothetical protein
VLEAAAHTPEQVGQMTHLLDAPGHQRGTRQWHCREQLKATPEPPAHMPRACPRIDSEPRNPPLGGDGTPASGFSEVVHHKSPGNAPVLLVCSIMLFHNVIDIVQICRRGLANTRLPGGGLTPSARLSAPRLS